MFPLSTVVLVTRAAPFPRPAVLPMIVRDPDGGKSTARRRQTKTDRGR